MPGPSGVTVNGVPVATNLIGGFHFQLQKLCWGIDGQYVEASGQDPLPVSLRPIGNSGVSSAKILTPKGLVKASSGQLYSLYVSNLSQDNPADRYLKFYDVADVEHLGESPETMIVPKLTLGIPAQWAGPIDLPYGTPFANGIALAVTATREDSDYTFAPNLVVNVFFA